MITLFCCCCFVFLPFLGLLPWHMEVPRLGVGSELQLLAYITATVMSDLSCVCNLHHSSRQCQILGPLSQTRDQTHNPRGSQSDSFLLHHNRNSITPLRVFLKPLSMVGIFFLATATACQSEVKFQGQGLSLHHSRDNARPLT